MTITKKLYLIKNLKKAVERVMLAKKKNEKIAVWGDYDPDGTCGATILYEALEAIGFKNILLILPDNEKYGRGFTEPSISKVLKNKTKLLIAVDFGTTEFDQAKYFKKKGVDLIILDHHLTRKQLPQGILINVKQKGDRYPFKEFSGAGIALKFVQALGVACGKSNLWKQWLDLVTIAIVADRVERYSKKSENLSLLNQGFKVFNKTSRLGIKMLLRELHFKKLTRQNIYHPFKRSFVEALELWGSHRETSLFKIFTGTDKKELQVVAKKMVKVSDAIRKETLRVFHEAEQHLKKHPNDGFVFLQHESKLPTVTSRTAGLFKDMHAVPIFIVKTSKLDKRLLRGSARAPDGVNLVEVLDHCKKYLKNYGGHKPAAGFALYKENLNDFKGCLEKYFNQKI